MYFPISAHLGVVKKTIATAALVGLTSFAAVASAQSLTVVSQDDASRQVQDVRGTTDVPLAPQRVVTLHNIFTEALIALDMAPAGSVERPTGLADQLADALADTASVGLHNTPDFEAILTLEPDLILATAKDMQDNYALLASIAPTLLMDEPNEDWREWLLQLGLALGAESEAREAIERYDSRASEVRTLVQNTRPDDTVLLLRVREKDIRVYGGARRSGPVLYTDLSLNPHPLVPLDENHVTVSNEIIPQLTADHIFLMVEDEARMAGIENSALWQTLAAVQAGQVYRVNIEPWNRSTGPISFGVIVEDVARHLGTDN